MIRSAIALIVVLLLSACVPHIKGYEGERLSRNQSAQVRVVAVDSDKTGVDLLNPATGKFINTGRVITYYDRTPWMIISATSACFLARSGPLRCPTIFEVLSPHNPGCTRIGLWVDQEICFDPVGRGIYEIQVANQRHEQCAEKTESTTFKLVDTATGEIVDEYASVDGC